MEYELCKSIISFKVDNSLHRNSVCSIYAGKKKLIVTEFPRVFTQKAVKEIKCDFWKVETLSMN